MHMHDRCRGLESCRRLLQADRVKMHRFSGYCRAGEAGQREVNWAVNQSGGTESYSIFIRRLELELAATVAVHTSSDR